MRIAWTLRKKILCGYGLFLMLTLLVLFWAIGMFLGRSEFFVVFVGFWRLLKDPVRMLRWGYLRPTPAGMRMSDSIDG